MIEKESNWQLENRVANVEFAWKSVFLSLYFFFFHNYFSFF